MRLCTPRYKIIDVRHQGRDKGPPEPRQKQSRAIDKLTEERAAKKRIDDGYADHCGLGCAEIIEPPFCNTGSEIRDDSAHGPSGPVEAIGRRMNRDRAFLKGDAFWKMTTVLTQGTACECRNLDNNM